MSKLSNKPTPFHEPRRDERLMKISEFAKENELSPRALRLYEERGLISPKLRSDSGFRLYTDEQGVRLKYIQKMKDIGCSLSEIQSLIHEWSAQSTAAEGMKTLEQLYRDKLRMVRDAIEKLKSVETELQESVDFIEGCATCDSDADPVTGCRRCDRPLEPNLTLIRGLTKR